MLILYPDYLIEKYRHYLCYKAGNYMYVVDQYRVEYIPINVGYATEL